RIACPARSAVRRSASSVVDSDSRAARAPIRRGKEISWLTIRSVLPDAGGAEPRPRRSAGTASQALGTRVPGPPHCQYGCWVEGKGMDLDPRASIGGGVKLAERAGDEAY